MNPLQQILYYKDMIIKNSSFKGLTENNTIAKAVLILIEQENPEIIKEAVRYHTIRRDFGGELSERYWPVQIPLRELGYL